MLRLPAALILLALPAQAAAQPSAESQLDFLVGEWTLHDPAGAEIGRARVAEQAPGAMLYEERRIGERDAQPLWFARFERDSGWTQLFVGAAGMVREFRPVSPPGAWPLVLGGDVTLRDGTPVRFRMTMTRASDDESGRILEMSRDSGATWTTTFDYRYRRAR